MALTGAEKTRRYREKLKKNRPEEYKAQCKRNLQRMNSKKKKISEMLPEEADAQRKKWREEKRRSNKNRKEDKNNQQELGKKDNESCVASSDNDVLKLRKKVKILSLKCKNFTTKIHKLQKQKEALKKRHQRLAKSTTKKITDLEHELKKRKAREEVLEHTLKTTYKKTNTHKEKRLLRQLIQNSDGKKHIRNMMGLKSKERKVKKKINRVEIAEITNFYVRDDVSRNTAGKKQTKTKNKEKMQIRYLTDTLVNLYKKYRAEGGRYGFTTFYKHKPFYVLSPHLNARDTCLCIRHSNLEFQHASLKKYGCLKSGVNEILKEIACNTDNYLCMSGKCNKCKYLKPQYCTPVIEEESDNNVSWFRWERQDHTYRKKEGLETKEIKTKKTAKVTKTGSLKILKCEFEKDLQEFKKHHFNMKHQHKQYQRAISQLKDNEVVLVCDFSENYEAKLGNEIQAMHFGASKNQISLHTGMIYWANKSQSFCTICELNDHQPPAIWAHLSPLIDLIKKESPNVSVIHFFSDGPSSQYRQKNNFYLIAHFTKLFGFDYATWSFFESGHGKSVADGIGGCVKCTLDRKVSQGMDVVDARNAYEILNLCLKNIKVFLIPESSVKDISKILPSNVQALKGTLHVHQIITINQNSVKFRDVSCFCGPLPGYCDCFSPQTHYVCSIRKQPLAQRKTKNISNCPDKFHAGLTPKNCAPTTSKEGLTFKDCAPSTSKEILRPERTGLDFDMTEIHSEPKNNVDLPIIILNDPIEVLSDCLPPTPEFITYMNSDESSNILGMENHENLIGCDQSGLLDDKLDMDTLPVMLVPNDGSKLCKPEPLIKNTAMSFTSRKPLSVIKNVVQKTINTRILQCRRCTYSILGQKAKCIVCLGWFCEECVDGSPTGLDYICNGCFGDY